MHLFDVNIPGSTCFKESNAMSPGNTLNTFQLGKFKVGLGICHDMRFSEMAALYRKQGLSIDNLSLFIENTKLYIALIFNNIIIL